MKLTRSSTYALAALACLARHGGAGLVPSHALAAQATQVPERFLLKLLLPLVSAGILRSVRGPGGGYKLARPANAISVLDVVQAVDGPLRGEAPEVGKGPAAAFDRRLRATCEEAARLTRDRLGRTSIAELARAR